mgnify:CR=1 FL=1
MERRTFLKLAALVPGLALAGCGGSKTLLSPKDPTMLSIWHVYGEQADSPMNRLLTEFNDTVGREKGILLNVTNMTNSAAIGGQLQDAKAVLDECRTELRAEGKKFDEKLEVGTMIETPAAVLIADELAEECDFFSIGTNDLTQYTCALDRQNAKLEPFFNPHHPAVLRAIKMTIDAGHRHGIWVGICGELGADTALTETFLRMGVDELSMNAKSILPVRKIIRGVDLSKPSAKNV